MKIISAIIKQDVINLIKNPMWDFYCIVFPLLLTFVLGFLGADSFGTKVNSYQYYFIGMCIYGCFNYGTISANAFLEERIKAGNMRIIYAPVKNEWLYLSKILATSLYGYLCMGILLLICMPFLQYEISIQVIPSLLLLTAMTLTLGSTIGVTLCCICKSENITNQIQSIIINLMALLGGIFFAMDGFGEWVHALTYLSLMKWLNIAVWGSIFEQTTALTWWLILGMAVGIVVLLAICKNVWKVEDVL